MTFAIYNKDHLFRLEEKMTVLVEPVTGQGTVTYDVGKVDVPEFEPVAEFTPTTDDQPYGGVTRIALTAKPQRWGVELLTAHTAAYTGKILFRRGDPDYKGRIQYHFNKDESFYLLSGRCILRWVENEELQTLEIGPGEAFHIPRFARHSMIALTDCIFFEVSTPHFEDRYNDDARWVIQEYLEEDPTYEAGVDEAGVEAAEARLAKKALEAIGAGDIEVI